ncbi:MAG: hypothetical protein PHQ52_03210 [Candidatus Omnitrophica bacterium]|nr:hypothetical protein [Candidatus Omnitrophota bacterium]
MKQSFKWQLLLAVFLVFMSLLVYEIHYLIFHDLHHIFLYLIGDIAFTFLEVLIVTLILHQLLGFREKQAIKKKINMVIGAFFSELGLELLRKLNIFNESDDSCFKELKLDKNESVSLQALKKTCNIYSININIDKGDIIGLKDLLETKRSFLISLLENPSILEHNTFSNMIWTVIHISDELTNRKELNALGAKG